MAVIKLGGLFMGDKFWTIIGVVFWIVLGIIIGILTEDSPSDPNIQPLAYPLGARAPAHLKGLGTPEQAGNLPKIDLQTPRNIYKKPDINDIRRSLMIFEYEKYKEENLFKTVGSFEIGPTEHERMNNGIMQLVREATIYKYTDNDTVLEIPEKIDGATVKYIHDNSFNNASNLQYLIIPDTVEYIYDKVFDVCKNLRSIKLPAGLMQTGVSSLDEYYISKNKRAGLYKKNEENNWVLYE